MQQSAGMNCLVQSLGAPSSSSPSQSTTAVCTSSPLGLGVELVEALSIVRGSSSSPSHEPHEPLEAAQARYQEATIADITNAEYRDLGDALASIFSASSPHPQPSESATIQHSVIDGDLSSCSETGGSSLTSGDLMLAGSGSSSCGSPSGAAQQEGKSPASSDSEDESGKQKTIKLPQRKGGMQLWQFLYALLSDPQYKDLTEWTENRKEREFRLHEPEAIAIWWGDHKNKRNMSYDKLSRSLRYYYDKGIIRKINGQRYVYRFCVEPEVMYRHIGNSDCRPRLKPMSIAAQNALSTANYQNMPYLQSMPSQPLHPALFNPHFVPLPYPTHTNNYSPFTPPTQSHSYLPAPVCSTSPPNYTGFPQPPTTQSYTSKLPSFHSHHLPPHKHLGPCQPPQISGNYPPSVYPLDEATFQPLMSEGTPSPQPISPLSAPPSFAHSSSSPHSPPPPYGWKFYPSTH